MWLREQHRGHVEAKCFRDLKREIRGWDRARDQKRRATDLAEDLAEGL
jgi:hypothetical protein